VLIGVDVAEGNSKPLSPAAIITRQTFNFGNRTIRLLVQQNKRLAAVDVAAGNSKPPLASANLLSSLPDAPVPSLRMRRSGFPD